MLIGDFVPRYMPSSCSVGTSVVPTRLLAFATSVNETSIPFWLCDLELSNRVRRVNSDFPNRLLIRAAIVRTHEKATGRHHPDLRTYITILEALTRARFYANVFT